MNLKEATIRVVDFETTGFDAAKEKICEVGWCDVTFDEVWKSGPEHSRFINPGIPIPSVASAVHHITDRDVADEPPQEEVLVTPFNDEPHLIAAHNAAFDEAFARAADRQGGPWLCTYRLALHRLPNLPSYKNQVLRYELGFVDVEGDAHRAGHDAKVTALILCHMLNGAETDLTVDSIVQYAERPVLLKGKIGFGKHRDAKWTEVPKNYLQWMQKQGEQSDGNPDGWDRDQWYTLNRVLGG